MSHELNPLWDYLRSRSLFVSYQKKGSIILIRLNMLMLSIFTAENQLSFLLFCFTFKNIHIIKYLGLKLKIKQNTSKKAIMVRI